MKVQGIAWVWEYSGNDCSWKVYRTALVVRRYAKAGCIGTVKMSYESGPYDEAAAGADVLQALKETQQACDVTQCPWCGHWGPEYEESARPADYCHHEHSSNS